MLYELENVNGRHLEVRVKKKFRPVRCIVTHHIRKGGLSFQNLFLSD